MHDVHRDSLIHKRKTKKKHEHSKPSHSGSEHQDHHDHEKHSDHGKDEHKAHSHEQKHDHKAHSHDHENDHDHKHEHGSSKPPSGHNHQHDNSAYEAHDSDLHVHRHNQNEHHYDRAWNHMHDHAHVFYHQHHHAHSKEHTGIVHKIFKDPLRDWFGATLIVLLISAGYLKWLPGHLSDGMLVCAAVIAIFPVFKNALFECIAKRRLSFELLLAILLVAGLFSGRFLEIALIALFLLVGSFMRLNFAWKDQSNA